MGQEEEEFQTVWRNTREFLGRRNFREVIYLVIPNTVPASLSITTLTEANSGE